MNKSFVLGAADPEMVAIEALIRSAAPEATILYAAAENGSRVRPFEAYSAVRVLLLDGTPFSGTITSKDVLVVETAVEGLFPTSVVDHHRPGDPGYGLDPSMYWEGSSIGQVYSLLEIDSSTLTEWHALMGQAVEGIAPDAAIRIIAAADHCLAAAYQGLCPDVAVEDLVRFRAASRAAFQRRSVEAVLADVAAAKHALQAAQTITLGGESVADLRQAGHVAELPEAAVQLGLGFIAEVDIPNGDRKVSIMGASPEAVRDFMDSFVKELGCCNIYGDPVRGFAGGTLPVK